MRKCWENCLRVCRKNVKPEWFLLVVGTAELMCLFGCCIRAFDSYVTLHMWETEGRDFVFVFVFYIFSCRTAEEEQRVSLFVAIWDVTFIWWQVKEQRARRNSSFGKHIKECLLVEEPLCLCLVTILINDRIFWVLAPNLSLTSAFSPSLPLNLSAQHNWLGATDP